MLEKRGVISDEDTPNPGRAIEPGAPLTKESADAMEEHPINDMIDAVVSQTAVNRE